MARMRISYHYDTGGNRSLLVDSDGGRFTYAYDSLNRISHLENPQNERTSYAYDAAGRRTLKKLANGTRASFSYDNASQLTRLANLKSDGTTISSFDYAYDKTGNRTAVLEADGSRVTWSYDATYHLSSEHRTGSNAYRNTFTYDAAGNRTLKNEDGARTTYAYDNANQLKTSVDSLGTTTYTFDADGDQQIVQPPTGPPTTTTWDYENRTTLVQLASGLRNTMAYVPDGLRIKLEDSTGTKKFVWDDQNYLAETDENNDTQVVYTSEPAFYGNLISQRRGSTTHWYHFDAIGSTRQLTLASEAVSDTYLYDAWGVPLSSTGSTLNPFRYIGILGYYSGSDPLSLYVRQRAYTPRIGRWTSTDPLSFVDGAHIYAYAHSNPIGKRDPSGTLSIFDLPDILLPAPCGTLSAELDAVATGPVIDDSTLATASRILQEANNEIDKYLPLHNNVWVRCPPGKFCCIFARTTWDYTEKLRVKYTTPPIRFIGRVTAEFNITARAIAIVTVGVCLPEGCPCLHPPLNVLRKAEVDRTDHVIDLNRLLGRP